MKKYFKKAISAHRIFGSLGDVEENEIENNR